MIIQTIAVNAFSIMAVNYTDRNVRQGFAAYNKLSADTKLSRLNLYTGKKEKCNG